jgi:hypothetical protein
VLLVIKAIHSLVLVTHLALQTATCIAVHACQWFPGPAQSSPTFSQTPPVLQTYTPLDMPGGAPFCSGHSILANGTVVAMGGDIGRATQTNGVRDIRTYNPAAPVGTRWRLEPVKLQSGQWYPTQLVLPNQKVLTLGGTYYDGGPGNALLSVWDSTTGAYSYQRGLAALIIWSGFNLYPACKCIPCLDRLRRLGGRFGLRLFSVCMYMYLYLYTPLFCSMSWIESCVAGPAVQSDAKHMLTALPSSQVCSYTPLLVSVCPLQSTCFPTATPLGATTCISSPASTGSW